MTRSGEDGKTSSWGQDGCATQAVVRRRTAIGTVAVLFAGVVVLFLTVAIWRCARPLATLEMDADGGVAASGASASRAAGIEDIVDVSGYEIVGSDADHGIFEIARRGEMDAVLQDLDARLCEGGWEMLDTGTDGSGVRSYRRLADGASTDGTQGDGSGGEGREGVLDDDALAETTGGEQLLLIAQGNDDETILLMQVY